MMRGLGSLLVGAAVLLVATSAAATPNFPGAIQTNLTATEAPKCAICHVCGITGRGTVNTPWGSAMRSRGLEAYNESSLKAALAKMEADAVDSDGDGTIDVAAVKMGKDPNPPTCEGGDDNPTIPQYGCVGRIAGQGGTPATGWILMGLVLAGAVLRRRRAVVPGILVLAIASASLAACTSGAPLAPRAPRAAPPPRMTPITSSASGADLAALGLDPRNLPAWKALTPRQLRGVMSTFTRTLGLACTDCHDASDYKVPTNKKRITARMWDDMTRRFAFADGTPLYCDSCHQGQSTFLARHDKASVGEWMSENLTGKLKKTGPTQERAVECETCHGDPFEPSIIAKWLR